MKNFLKAVLVVILLILFLAFISCNKIDNNTTSAPPTKYITLSDLDKCKTSGTKIEVEWISGNVKPGFNKVTIDDTVHLIVLRCTESRGTESITMIRIDK